MIFLIRFWGSLTKKENVKSAKYEINKKIILKIQFMDLFSQIRIRIIRIGSGFLADPDTEKNLDPKHCLHYLLYLFKALRQTS